MCEQIENGFGKSVTAIFKKGKMDEKQMSIGIFDSGIGGMTLLHQAMVLLPHEKYIFYADTDHVPYGTKSREQVVSYVDEVMRFLVVHGCKAVVIACNTATAVAAEAMRRKYTMPIIGIEPAVKPAVAESHGKRVLVVATPLTVHEEKLINLVSRVDCSHQVDLLPLPRLVEFAERGEFVSDEVTAYLTAQLSGFDLLQYSELVLGCTHFNFFKDSFRRILPAQVQMIDGSEGTIKQLARVLEARGELVTQTFPENNNIDIPVRYFYSGREVTDAQEQKHMEALHQRLELMRKIQ